MSEFEINSNDNYATYGIKSVRELKRSTRGPKGPTAVVGQNKGKLYDYFLRHVDPVVGDCITHLLCCRPDNVIDEMLSYLRNKKENKISEKFSKNDINQKPSTIQKVFLATKISPVISILINKIAVSRPEQLLDFMINEVNSMAINELAIIQENSMVGGRGENNSKYSQGISPIPEKLFRPTTATHRPEDSISREIVGLKQENETAKANRPVTAPTVQQTSIVENSNQMKCVQIGLLGLNGAGKTSLINSLQGAYDPKVRPTIGFRPVTMMLDESTQIKFYDLGGGRKIRDIWSQYYHDIHCVIYVIDASASLEDQQESAEIFRTVLNHPSIYGKPILIMANKHDIAGASSADAIRKMFGLADVPATEFEINIAEIYCNSVSNNENDNYEHVSSETDQRIESGMEWMINTVQNSFDRLDLRVREDSKKKAAEEAKKRLDRERRVLKNKIAVSFSSTIDAALLPADLPTPNPEDAFTESEGITFLAAEIGKFQLHALYLLLLLLSLSLLLSLYISIYSVIL